MQSLAVVCADIGSVAKNNFGWWSSAGETGDKPSRLVGHVAALLAEGRPVALGFECPLFVPIAQDESQLTSARPGEGSRAWSAGAGCGALATGLVQVVWILQELRNRLSEPVPAFLSWEPFSAERRGLLIWEAFVSGKAKFANHAQDAEAGGRAFIEALPDPAAMNAIVCTGAIQSLAGAALLRTGWSGDVRLLGKACLVLRAKNVV